MKIGHIAEKIKLLCENINHAEFLYGLLECYGKPRASITRLKMTGRGSYNLAKDAEEVLWKKQVYFRRTNSDRLLSVIDGMKNAEVVSRHQPRFIIAINSTHIVAIDTKEEDTLDVALVDLSKKVDFFLPWTGKEKYHASPEDPADVKAAEKMAKLFDLLRADNKATTAEEIHRQNVFLSRILFCFFAEDTGIFTPKLFTNHVASHTAADGSDLDEYLSRVFEVMNQESREGIPDYLDFPYVNGGLFADNLPIPKFSRRSRAMLIECGSDLNWSEINPDIFGSMIQAVVDPAKRATMGMHYTNVSNIKKVIEPLFINELKEEFELHSDSKVKLEQLLLRLEHLKVFDPACGSGNFLIIAYKELRQLEIDIFKHLQKISKHNLIPLSRIKLSQFYGIELDDFAHEIAILSMWLAEHQMNLKFRETFGHTTPALPLKNSGNVVCNNANEIAWTDVCPHSENSEIYLVGNPPYLGSSLQSAEQKADMTRVLGHIKSYKKLDYIAAWFYRATEYIAGQNARSAFVTTNSICQGEQVSILWPPIFEKGIEIDFAHQSFKWNNNAKNNAGVTCIIVGLRNCSNRPKYIYTADTRRPASNINAYLIDYKNLFISNRRTPIASISPMSYGSKPADGGHLILSPEAKISLIEQYPDSVQYIKRYIGTDEFLYSLERYCLWILDEQVASAQKIPPINERLKGVRKMREESTKIPTQEMASYPNRFGESRHVEGTHSIIVPAHSSENRRCVPMGFLDGNSVVSNSAYLVLNADAFDLGVLQSTMHTAWIKAVGGALETRIRYSSSLCYNNFPFPKVTESQKRRISECALEIVAQRELYSELTLDELYEPIDMPQGLEEAHDALDLVVDSCYRAKPFENEDERVIFLFKLFEKMTGSQNA
ncbi:methyltransferase domain protein [Bordetella hinzii 5132]|uniref:class I SAM-dependent DNA methyltransferase n=1 Tax=Bordetella hinzii TaxID=103855 RepID=UPI00045A5ACA|nr:DNA methyltransferase [Bordetella hinzii]KCB41350.1 methyltransferase domain protein [Bordetella hinzii 5132]